VVGILHSGMISGVCVGFGIGGEFNRNSYSIATVSNIGRFLGYQFIELPTGARPEPSNFQGDVFGCGVLMHPDNKVTTFFTLNGILLGELFLVFFIYKFII
jgi:hypothetical protein